MVGGRREINIHNVRKGAIGSGVAEVWRIEGGRRKTERERREIEKLFWKEKV